MQEYMNNGARLDGLIDLKMQIEIYRLGREVEIVTQRLQQRRSYYRDSSWIWIHFLKCPKFRS